MDEYGHLQNIPDMLNDTIFISENTTWNQKRFLYSHIVIQNNAILSINDTVTFYNGVTMTVNDGGTLRVNGGHMISADIKTGGNNHANIDIINNGVIENRKNGDFIVPIGSTLNINYGTIK